MANRRFFGVPTTNLRRGRNANNPAARREIARREDQVRTIVALFSRFQHFGRNRFEQAIDRAVHAGQPVPHDRRELFEVRRIFAYAEDLSSAAIRGSNWGRPPRGNKSWFTVDHIHPLSKGGATNSANLAVAYCEDDSNKGNREGVTIRYFEVPEGYGIPDNRQGGALVTSYTGI